MGVNVDVVGVVVTDGPMTRECTYLDYEFVTGHISVTRYDLCYCPSAHLGSLPVNENTAKWVERRWKDEYTGTFTVLLSVGVSTAF